MENPMKLQRRHFAAIAKELFDKGANLDAIKETANKLTHTNPFFNRTRFIEAALGRPTGRDVAALRRKDFTAIRNLKV
jgi:hypothetical protein